MCAGNCVPEEVPAGGRTRAAIRPKNVCKCVIVCPLSVAIRALGIFIMICLLLAMSAKCELFSNEMVDGGVMSSCNTFISAEYGSQVHKFSVWS